MINHPWKLSQRFRWLKEINAPKLGGTNRIMRRGYGWSEVVQDATKTRLYPIKLKSEFSNLAPNLPCCLCCCCIWEVSKGNTMNCQTL